MPKPCLTSFLGRVDYAEAVELQMAICSRKKQGMVEDVLLLLEHPPTVTLGRNGDWRHLLAADAVLARRGVRLYETDRGGDITFHGPGQLVGYLLLELGPGERDVHLFMRNLEESIIRTLADRGILGCRQERLTGVWTDQGKVAAMGIHVSRWITRHGFALNVNTDLTFFDLIVPCGIPGRTVASMAALTGDLLELHDVARDFSRHFGEIFRRAPVWIDAATLRSRIGADLQAPGPETGTRTAPTRDATGAASRGGEDCVRGA